MAQKKVGKREKYGQKVGRKCEVNAFREEGEIGSKIREKGEIGSESREKRD